MSYWLHWHNIRYEIVEKRIKTNLCMWIARHLPRQVRMWVVVDSANVSILRLHPRPDGYAGPDGLTFKEMYDGAMRERVSA
jgi:hypothetical protein